ncbi:MAG TPA: segregation/condensation protein A [Bacillota bacterium]|nr:segregation/condensation protein A [Bacillota bacterium]
MDYEIKLDVFEGPLDLLLHLIEKDEIDIYNIPIALITERYLEYLHTIQMLNLDGVGDFLVMAATLMQIKAKLLLPQTRYNDDTDLEPEEDPRFELARKLVEYKKIKDAAVLLQEMEEKQFTVYNRVAGEFPDRMTAPASDNFKEMSVWELFDAFKIIIDSMEVKHLKSAIPKPEISIKQRMTQLLDRITTEQSISFRDIFNDVTTKVGLITCFLAVLELLRLRKLTAYQDGIFGNIILTLPEKVGNRVESDAS